MSDVFLAGQPWAHTGVAAGSWLAGGILLLSLLIASAPPATAVTPEPAFTAPRGGGTVVNSMDPSPPIAEEPGWVRPSTTPVNARVYHGMAYDSESDRVIMFGGLVTVPFNETWSYDLNANTWTNMNPLPNPGPRAWHGMAYDSESDRVILFGGRIPMGAEFGDTWAYDFNANSWTEMTPAGPPSPRDRAAIAYDTQSDRVVLFGGFSGSDETWAYGFNTDTWTNLYPVVHPPATGGRPMAYDSRSDRIVLPGAETWSYDLDTNTWTVLRPVLRPSFTTGYATAYDSESDRLIVFGGFVTGGGPIADTWAYDLETNTFTGLNQWKAPNARWRGSLAYDSDSKRVILFGGVWSSGSGDTWSYDVPNLAWTDLQPPGATGPGPSLSLYDNAMVYDSKSDRAIVFGGLNSQGTASSDYTSAYDDRTNLWYDMSPPAHPSARYGHAMAYDSKADRVILFGGFTATGPSSDTWAYDYDTNLWALLPALTSPAPRWGHSMAYDAQSDRVILFGGFSAGARFADTWSFDFNALAWTSMDPTVHPSERYRSAMVYDSQADRAVLFGGEIGTDTSYVASNETWSYDVGTNTWTELSPATRPSARSGHVMAYDSDSGRIVLFGGRDAAGLRGDTWLYQHPPTKAPPPAIFPVPIVRPVPLIVRREG